jgi:hypothetical protein
VSYAFFGLVMVMPICLARLAEQLLETGLWEGHDLIGDQRGGGQ